MEPSHASPSTTISLLLADNPNRSQTKTALLLAQRYAERHGLALRYAPVVVTDTLADDAATQTTMVKLQQIVKGRLDALRDYLRIQLEVAGNSANNASDNFILWLSGDTFLLDDNMPPTSLFAGVKPLFQGVVPHAYPLVYARFDPIGTQRLHVGSMIVRVSSVTLELLDALLKHAREYYNGISGTSVDSNAISKIASITTTTLPAMERELWWTILRSLRWHDRVVDAPRLHVRGDRWRLGDALVSVSAEDIGGRAVERQRRRRECLRAYSEIRAMLDVVRGEQRYTDK